MIREPSPIKSSKRRTKASRESPLKRSPLKSRQVNKENTQNADNVESGQSPYKMSENLVLKEQKDSL